ncbi:MAG TPA: DUF3822 family protein [Cytophagales bacterium]|nr:DUF3822 family protein [Cytophagales bacterium]
MNTTSVYNRVKYIKDEKFNIEYISQYELLLYLNGHSFFVSVVDTLDHRCLFFEEYEILEDHLISVLEEIFDDHYFLRAAFWKKIKFSQYNNKFTLIPNGLFVTENAFDYLDLITDVTLGLDKVLHYKHENLGLTNVFAVNYALYEWLTEFYHNKKIVFIHPTGSHIEMLMKVKSSESYETLDITFHQNAFDISYKKNNKLEFCNIFDYYSESDVLYFLLAVVDSLNIDTRNLSCNLYGTIDHNSILFSKIKEFVKNTKFGSKPSMIQFSHAFDELYLHQYNDLFPMYIC